MSLLMVSQLANTLAVVLAMVCFVIIALQRPSAEQRIGVIYIVFSIVSCFGYWGIVFSHGNRLVLVYATKLKYIGSLVLGLVFLLTTKYLKIKIPKVVSVLLYGSVIFVMLLVFTFDAPSTFVPSNPLTWGFFLRKLLFKYYSVGFHAGVPYLYKDNNWGHTIYLSLSFVYAVALGIGYYGVVKHHERYDFKNITILYLIIVIPDLCYIIDKIDGKIFEAGAGCLQTVPFGMVISDFLFVYLICLRRFCNVNELANTVFFDVITTPAFVVDEENRLVNFNRTAKLYFSELNDDLIGKNILYNFPGRLSALVNILLENLKTETGLEPIGDEKEELVFCDGMYFQPKLFSIQSDSKFKGFVIWLEDVTNIQKENSERMNAMRDKMILGFSSLAENHDFSTQGHLHRTAAYARAIAEELMDNKFYTEEIDMKFVNTILQVAPLHDIGKTYIDKEIFNKPEKLNAKEVEIMKQHTTLGAQFLKNTLKDSYDSLYVRMAIDIALCHHEWWNGCGYPGRLRGKEIPLSARIMAVADTFDALVTARPYKRPYTCDEAFEIIEKESGTHFEPAIVLIFLSISDKIRELKRLAETEEAAELSE